MRSAIALFALTVSACGDVGGNNSGGTDKGLRGQIETMKIGDGYFAAYGDKNVTETEWIAAAQKSCEGQSRCDFMGWNDKANIPTKMPMLDREANSMVFNYSLNRDSNFEQSLFNCDVFKGKPSNQCMAKFEPE
jgi:hypothetical protein